MRAALTTQPSVDNAGSTVGDGRRPGHVPLEPSTKGNAGLEGGVQDDRRTPSLDNRPLHRVLPRFEKVGFGVIPEEGENQWPSKKKRRVGARKDSFRSKILSVDLSSANAPRTRQQARREQTRSGQDSNNKKCQEPSDPVATRGKADNLKAICSRVGPQYQVEFIPPCGTAKYDDGKIGDVLWDPVLFNKAGRDVHCLLQEQDDMPLMRKMVLLQAVNDVGYDAVRSRNRFIELVQQLPAATPDPLRQLTDIEVYRLHQIFENQEKKDFVAISKHSGHSMDSILVEYYSWKASNRKEYQRAKTMRNSASPNDYCEICNDGGSLIICDVCRKSFHLECLDPPLEKVPEGSWFCNNCIARSPIRVIVRPFHGLPRSPKASKSPISMQTSIMTSPTHFLSETPTSSKISLGNYYVAEIPLGLDKKLHIQVAYDHSVGGVVFRGYTKPIDGTRMAYAEANGVFKSKNDIVCAINGRSIKGLTWEETAPLIEAAKKRSSSLRFLMCRQSVQSQICTPIVQGETEGSTTAPTQGSTTAPTQQSPLNMDTDVVERSSSRAMISNIDFPVALLHNGRTSVNLNGATFPPDGVAPVTLPETECSNHCSNGDGPVNDIAANGKKKRTEDNLHGVASSKMSASIGAGCTSNDAGMSSGTSGPALQPAPVILPELERSVIPAGAAGAQNSQKVKLAQTTGKAVPVGISGAGFFK